MSIIKTVNFCEFTDTFNTCNRLENFSYDGLRVIYDYLNDLSRDTDNDIELDVIAICCEYSEETFEEVKNNYNLEENLGNEEIEKELENKTFVLGTTENTIIYQQF